MADTLVARVRMVEGTTSLVSVRTHAVVVDRPQEKGGSDLGPLGGELLLVAEGGCLMSNLVAAAQARNITLVRAEMEVRGEQAQSPARFARIEVDVRLEADAADEDLDKLVTIAERACLVSNTLRAGTELVVRRVAVPTTA